MEIKLHRRKNLKALSTNDKKITVLEGSSGSGKTWDSLYYLIWVAQQNENAGLNIVVARAQYSWVHDSVLSDFLRILKKHNLYNQKDHKQSHPVEYELFGNSFKFRGADDPAKFQGPRWDIVYLNEGMEFKYEQCSQIFMRTNLKIIIDYNPRETEHWIYDRIVPRDDCLFIHSTFMDNPDLPVEQRKEILGYEPTEENYERGTADPWRWDVYGLGKRAQIEGVIFKNWDIEDFILDPNEIKWQGIGVDFGFVHDPSSAIICYYAHGKLYLRELFHRKGMTTSEIFEELEGYRHMDMVGDSAEPRLIAELNSMGLNMTPSMKGKGSVKLGIDKLKRYKHIIHANSKELIKAWRNYKYKKVKDVYIDEPEHKFSHGPDAVRYLVDYMTSNKSFYVV